MNFPNLLTAGRCWLIRFCWLLLLAGAAACEETTVEPVFYGKLKGVVKDSRSNQPLANVAISTTPATMAVTTDASGGFEIDNIPTGRLTIVAALVDYQQTTTSITIEENRTANASITLTRTPSTAPPAAPVQPTPADQASGVGVDVRLQWRTTRFVAADSLRYEVVLYEGTSSVRRQVLTNSRDTLVQVNGLLYNTVYFWQVTVRNGNGLSTRSALWSFRTRALPDNRYLYTREISGNVDIYSSDASGGNLVRLTSSPFVEQAPQLSPLRDRVAYTSNATGEFHLYTMNRDGSDQRRISVLGVSGYHNNGTAYCWSPDGAQLLYAHYDKLYRINRDGSGLQLLITAPTGRHFREMRWSALANKIIVQTIGTNIFDSELYQLNSDGTGLSMLIGNLPGRMDSPSFSVDGRSILYTRDLSGINDAGGRQLNSRIFAQMPDGSGLLDLSVRKPAGTNDLFPQYSPDGSKIIFVNMVNDNVSPPEIWMMDAADGNNRVRLFQNAAFPDWR